MVEWETSSTPLDEGGWTWPTFIDNDIHVQEVGEGYGVVRDGSHAVDPVVAGPFPTLEAAKVAYLMLASIR